MDYEPLLPNSSNGPTTLGLFNDGNRPTRDLKWAKAWCGAAALAVLGGVVSCFTSNNNAFFYSDGLALDSCSAGIHGRSLKQSGIEDIISGYHHPVWPLLLTAVVSLGSGWLFLLGFKHYAGLMVKVSLGAIVAYPTLLSLLFLLGGVWPGAIIFGAIAAMFAWLIYYNRNQIELVTRLLGISSHAITEVPGLVGMSVALQAVQVFVLLPVYAIFIVQALATGSLVRNSTAQWQMAHVQHSTFKCVDAHGAPTSCCRFETSAWGIVYLVFIGGVALWTNMLIGQIQSFTVAGAVAQWYFTPAWLGPASSLDKPGHGKVMKSFRHAMGPSFGSLCASAAVLGVINMLQEWLRSCERQARMRHPAAIIFWVLAIILRSLLSMVEFLTRLTTARMAITGEAFFDSAHSTFAIMKRNGLETLGVWWMPRYILVTTALMTAIVYGAVLYGLGELAWWGDSLGSFILAFLGAYVSYIVIVFFCVLLLNAVDGAFMCFLMDRDAARVTRQEVHDVLKGLPGLQGQVVELPDGDLMYGAPATSAAPAGQSSKQQP